jgi:hypothetical protein
MVLREADVGITPRDHLGDIPMSDAEATGKVVDLVGNEGLGGRLSDQPFDSGPVASVRACLGQISLRRLIMANPLQQGCRRRSIRPRSSASTPS